MYYSFFHWLNPQFFFTTRQCSFLVSFVCERSRNYHLIINNSTWKIVCMNLFKPGQVSWINDEGGTNQNPSLSSLRTEFINNCDRDIWIHRLYGIAFVLKRTLNAIFIRYPFPQFFFLLLLFLFIYLFILYS